MRLERIDAEGEPGALAATLRALVPGGSSVAGAVTAIVAAVRDEGDEALQRLTEEHDTAGAPAPPLRVTDAELQQALANLDPAVRAGLELANANVGRVAAAPIREPVVVDFDDHQVIVREVPVHRAAIYVPGGRAPYPSTVVMGVATARAAGVGSVAVSSPPGPNGEINSVILAACALTGADEVYRAGGAQAIAALALGTETIAKVDVVVGPGNLYVQEAKRQLSGTVGIDSFAGPSDVLVLAAADADAREIAFDLLAQAEHGPGTLAVGALTDGALLAAVAAVIEESSLDTPAKIALTQVPSLEYALALAEVFAPEHLELLGPLAEQLSGRITRSGCVFVGTGTAFGDYIAGSNHTLPTSGAARFASMLGAHHFRRVYSEVRIAQPDALARAAAPIARAEGFELHAQSMEIRIRER
jgi:histidinol dehydrogenase